MYNKLYIEIIEGADRFERCEKSFEE